MTPAVIRGVHIGGDRGNPVAASLAALALFTASAFVMRIRLARRARSAHSAATVRFVAFVNQDPPWFQTPAMGSVVYAAAAKARGDRITAMVSLESVGNFVAATSNFGSWSLLRQVTRAFRLGSALPMVTSPAPERIAGVGWSDHWAFWQQGYPGVMLTGTAPFRNARYHTPGDLPETLDLRDSRGWSPAWTR
jgi:hypothetical protein